MNEATDPPLVVTKAEIALVTVDTDGSLTEITIVVDDATTVGGVVTIEAEVDDKGEHPRKSGILILYVAQSARSKASAAIVWSDGGPSIQRDLI